METRAFVEEIAFSRIHVFPYSPRKGTPAASFADQVPAGIKEKRSRQLIALGRSLEQAYIKQFEGRQVMVLFEEEHPDLEGCYEGYTDQYVRVMVQGGPELEGKLLPVMVEEALEGCLKGRTMGLNKEAESDK